MGPQLLQMRERPNLQHCGIYMKEAPSELKRGATIVSGQNGGGAERVGTKAGCEVLSGALCHSSAKAKRYWPAPPEIRPDASGQGRRKRASSCLPRFDRTKLERVEGGGYCVEPVEHTGSSVFPLHGADFTLKLWESVSTDAALSRLSH